MKLIYSVLCPWQGKLYYFGTEQAANRFATQGNLQSVKHLNPTLKKSKLKAFVPFLSDDQSYQVVEENLLKSSNIGNAVEEIRQCLWDLQQYELAAKDNK